MSRRNHQKPSNRIAMLGAAACAAFPFAQVHAQGSAFPSRPVTLISTTAAGGPIDIEARLHAKKMTELLGQPFLLDYKPGAGTTIGTAYVAKAAPDGYTLLVTNSSFTLITALYKDLSFDPIKDFAPISMVSQRYTVLAARPSFPAKNFSEYLAYARANPGKVNFGTVGAGSATHMAGAWMSTATNTTVTFVHYKGIAPSLLDLTAGRLDVAPASLSIVLPQIKAGKVKALVVMNDKHAEALPGVATVAEQGIPDYNYVNWMGFLAPGATPTAIVNKLSDGFARGVKAPEVTAMLEAEGNIPVGNTPAQFRQVIVSENARWAKLVQDVGIKLEE